MFKNQIKNINSTEGFSTVQCVVFHAYVNDIEELSEFYFSRYGRRRNYETVQLEPMTFFLSLHLQFCFLGLGCLEESGKCLSST